ncbi:MAG: sulfotransferase family protein, partial [Chloroflexota bacterium]
MSKTTRIAVWSGPRNISTALMYSFAQRQDTRVFDEPLYGHYLSTTDAYTYHPGSDEVIASQENDWRKVVEQVILADYDEPVVFFKLMTHHMVNLEWDFTTELCNVILTRDPWDMLPSYAKNVEMPSLHDTGYALHVELMEYLHQRGHQTPVIESRAVLSNPRSVLSQLCDQIGIPFDEAMLSWEAGARPEDGVWAPYWY